MNVKALMFAAGGFVVFATLATIWMQHDMAGISAEQAAKLKKTCHAAATSATVTADKDQVAKCKAVGVPLTPAVVTDGGTSAPGTPVAGDGASGDSQLAPLQAMEASNTDPAKASSAAKQAHTSVLAADTNIAKGPTAADTIAHRSTDPNRVITKADSVPLDKVAPAPKLTPNSNLGFDPDMPEPDSPLDGSVSSVILNG